MKISSISNKEIPRGEEIKGEDIRPAVFEFIRKTYPVFGPDHYISMTELNRFRRLYLTFLIESERGELAQLDKVVLQAIKNNSILSEIISEPKENRPTISQKIADVVAGFGGSWMFISSFLLFILLWIFYNSYILLTKPFDPYPFILLNLILSCVAAIQAPIIMMSQNRVEDKDRQRAEHDYKINLKAELEIKLLSEKIDHLLVNQNIKLLEIQELQSDYLSDLMNEIKKVK